MSPAGIVGLWVIGFVGLGWVEVSKWDAEMTLKEQSPIGFSGRLLPLGVEGHDGSVLHVVGMFQHRPLPVPLRAVPEPATRGSHLGSVVVGVINELWIQDKWVMGCGEMHPGLGDGLAGVLASRLLVGEALPVGADVYLESIDGRGGLLRPHVDWKFAGATVTSKPVFEGACIWLVGGEGR